jgi:hypothetical protein
MVRLVRDQAFKAIDLFVKRLESHAAKMVTDQLLSLAITTEMFISLA